jgi:peptidoglycan/xylan/chitin deacetylase (PgdA/CDA1 family)
MFKLSEGNIVTLSGSIANVAHLERWHRPNHWTAVLFHHLTDGITWRADDPLIRGLNADMPSNAFKDRIRWLAERYAIVSLDAVLGLVPRRSKKRRLLICFDDGYASVADLAAPILREIGVPWCLFINPSSVGSSILPVDNQVAYVVNVHGLGPLSEAAGRPVASIADFIGNYLATQSPERRRNIVDGLAHSVGIDPSDLARKSALHLTEAQVRQLANEGVEIGNHTLDHVHCRALDATSSRLQIEESAKEVARISGKPVRTFAYPYGWRADATELARFAVVNSGHQCAFLVHNQTNNGTTDRYGLYRIDLGEMSDSRAALELEVLPRMRALVAGLRG